eukprot:NODE_2685_length_454_cov_535.279012_g2223_i0.p1 GENE.NODE_2685_length_454_cov_535.279012_g2223_i0~~NODE_2685_length_454_cov_535.279012_g2223_i0.p1  ORF type:complete len:126 (-),score=46.47 NODE_2685_length_454_cov_535.279012_g2223_i0:77-424(-)
MGAAKADLEQKQQRKVRLTEHLSVVIQQNELRKSEKLEEMMSMLHVVEAGTGVQDATVPHLCGGWEGFTEDELLEQQAAVAVAATKPKEAPAPEQPKQEPDRTPPAAAVPAPSKR